MKIKLLILTLLLSFVGLAQTNSYLGLDGGFEGTATIINGTTNAAPVITNWTKANTNATIASETGTVRSGSNSMRVNSVTASTCRVFSPSVTVPASTTRWVIQYYRRATSITNGVQNQLGNYRGGTETLNGVYTTVTAANTWEKVTYAPTSVVSATTAATDILVKMIGTGGDMFYDDFAVYESAGGVIDVTPANTPGAVTVNNPTNNSLDISWGAATGGVDGGGYIVVRGTVDPTTAPNVNGIYAVGNAIAAGMTVVYQGTGTSFTNTGLTSNTNYFYRVYTYDKAYNYSGAVTGNGTTTGGCVPPSTQASAISINTITPDGCNVAWTAGNGTGGTMIVVRPTGSANTLPSSGTAYAANLAWGSAGTIDANNRVIFRNAGTTAGPITGLTPGTQYTVTAYEYNTSGDCYNTTTPPSTTFYTLSDEPTAHAAAFSCTTVSSTQIDLTFSQANTITNGKAYLVLRKIGSAPTGLPTDGVLYSAGNTIGDATVVGMTSLAGTDTTLSATGLTPGTNYYFTLIPINCFLSVPETLNYRTSPTIPGSNCTTTGASIAITSSLTSSSVYGSVYSYTITASGSPTSYNAVGLPAGLTVDTVTGIISGTPTVGVGSYNIDISATDGVVTDTKTLVLTITAKNLTITGLIADNKVYDRTLTATLSGTPTLVGVVGSDAVTVSGLPSPTFATVIVGTAKPVTVTGYTLSGAQSANYTVTQPTGFTANITAKPLTIPGAVANNKPYDGTTTATITGAALVGVIAPDVVSITPSGTFASANVGTAITVTSTSIISGADSANYSLTQPTGLAADITQASQTITFNPLVVQYTGAANFNLTATASSGLTVTYVSSNPAVATVSGNTVTIVGIGTTVITASQAGNGNYAAAVDVNQNQIVTNAPCLSSNFDSSTFVPAGWSGSSINDLVVGHFQSAPNCRALGATKDLITSTIDNPTLINFYVDASGGGGQVGTLWYRIGAGPWISIGTFTASNAGATVSFDLTSIIAETNVSFRISSAANTIYIDDLRAFCGTVWNGLAWSNGAPNLTSTALINGDYNTTTNGDIDSNSLIVNTTFTATITGNHYINIQNNLTVNGTLDVQDNGSLVQISDTGVNTGNISMKRIATIKSSDYVYWSTPVANFAVTAVSPTTSNNLIWKWNPSIANGNNGFGNWQNANETMSIGKGYVVRGPSSFSNSITQDLTANFIGVPNNGIKDVNVERGNYTGIDYTGANGALITKNEDNWNLIGNPYPSAINAKDFMTLNTNIEGSVRLWTHGTSPTTSAANPFYNSYVYNYSATDYLTYNLTGTQTQAGFDGYIGAGQSFFVLMNDGAAATETVRFQNSLRLKTYRNDQFYKNSNSQNTASDIERHRIWVDLISSTGTVNRTLVGYVEGATQEKDRLYDAYSDHKSMQDFYSVLNNESLVIQGRALPFADSDLVPMGVKIPANGTYTIAIAAVDGLFSGNAQTVYLEDKVLNTIHNLSVAPYQFTATKGIVDTRFVLRYTNQTLGNNDFELIENNVKVYTSGNTIHMDSKLENIKSYQVYNILGQSLASKNNVNANLSMVNSIMKNNQALIVKLTLENGQIVTKKIIF
ncbi:YDG domain-containing protein [Flavobacterium sp.]|uniref:YDG domain-containing protein n=1 Tax=Flavobacterium sp. TaxID=239 RepID=UPI002634F420|nr:YDG domain-containing protein [Flavobacterium sp.]